MTDIVFKGEVAVVTGAGRGLGRAYALDLARRGARVVVNDIGGTSGNEAPWAAAVVDEIRAAGGTAMPSFGNVTTPEGGQRIIDDAVTAFGSIDALVCNAGFLRPALFEDLTLRQIRDVIDVHLMAAFHIGQPAWRVMKARGYGRIVFTSSSAAFGNGTNSNYAAAKTGLIGLAKGLAMEGAGHGIRVNCIFPSALSKINVDNPIEGDESRRNRAALTAMRHRRLAESVAPLVTYLASRECARSGQVYTSLAGRHALVALQMADGWLAPDATAVSAEDIRDRLGEIEDLSRSSVPATMTDEIEGVLNRIRRELPAAAMPDE